MTRDLLSRLFGRKARRFRPAAKDAAEAFRRDQEAIASDWQAVGDEMRGVLGITPPKENLEKKNERKQ